MTFPVSAFSNIEFELVSDTRAAEARLFRYTSKGSKEPYFMFALTTTPVGYAEGMALAAELDSYQGELETFTLQSPFTAIGNATSMSLTDTFDKGVKVINVTCSGTPSAGDFIQISGSTKAYSIRRVNGTGAGTYDLTLSQGLIQKYFDYATIKYASQVSFQVCMTNRDSAKIDAKKGMNEFVFDVELIEQL